MATPTTRAGRPSRLARIGVLALLVALLAAACGDDSPEPAPSASDRPTGATDVVASRRFAGGFTMPGADLSSLPDVIVYGDGLALAPTQDGRVLQLRLPAGEVDDLLSRLLDTGLADLPARVEPDGPMVVVDASDTILTVADGDTVHEVAANALDVEGTGYPEGLVRASVILQTFGDRVRAEGEPWTGDGIRVVVMGVGSQEGAVVAWPADVAVPAALSGFTADPMVASADFSGSDAEALSEAFAGQQFAEVSLPGVDQTLSIAWRPLLPHEVAEG